VQKRKRREYRLHRNNAFTRPDPGFSLYEGRTRGKRQRYTFSDEEDFDSDNLSTRRSTRTSGRETPAVPSGPTVTASGRQVRSRATGLYGETLHSGQVSDRASPATGDYVRSDVSEEPQQPHVHGRSTRAANKGAVNGRPSRRALDSEDEEEATSWDGGDEEDDEPERMELDDDEDGQGDDSSEDEEAPQTLLVTLRYRKGAFNPPNGRTTNTLPAKDTMATNGVAHQETHPPSAPQQPPLAPAPVEPPVQPSPYTQPTGAFVPNGIPILSHPPPAAPTVSVAHQPLPTGDPVTLPKLDGFSAAPPQPYGVPEHNAPVPHQQQAPYAVTQPLPLPPQQHQPPLLAQQPHLPAQQPHLPGQQASLPAQQQQPFAPKTLPPPTPASSWQ
jgi:hypothetical protein